MGSIEHRHECTKADPWDRSKSFYGDHPDAIEVEAVEYMSGNVVTRECPHCGLRFREW